MTITQEILQEKDYLISLRRYFHARPEPALEEVETCKKIASELEELAIPYEYIAKTAIVAKIIGKKEGKGKVVALRSDIDALKMDDLKDVPYKSQNPGLCHACGHDAHTATLLAAAKILKAQEETFSGEIRLFFQPAEEIGGGARFFTEQGLLKDVDRLFSVHVASELDSGKVAITPGAIAASCDYFKIKVKGRGTHVATAYKGVDALYVASQIVVNLQSIVSRNTKATETVVVGVGVLNAGSQYNIVAENAVLEGTTRAFSRELQAFTNDKVATIASQTAELFGAEASIEFENFASPVVNDKEVAEEVTEIATKIFGAENIINDQEKKMGADDFSFMLEEAKGVYAFVGTRNEQVKNSDISHHHGLFDIDENALLASCQLYVDFAKNYLV